MCRETCLCWARQSDADPGTLAGHTFYPTASCHLFDMIFRGQKLNKEDILPISNPRPLSVTSELNRTRLACHRFVINRVRLWLFVLTYNPGNFMRRLTLPESVKHGSLRSAHTKLNKMGGRLVRHARRLVFQLAEVAVSRDAFRQVLERIAGLHPAPG